MFNDSTASWRYSQTISAGQASYKLFSANTVNLQNKLLRNTDPDLGKTYRKPGVIQGFQRLFCIQSYCFSHMQNSESLAVEAVQ